MIIAQSMSRNCPTKTSEPLSSLDAQVSRTWDERKERNETNQSKRHGRNERQIGSLEQIACWLDVGLGWVEET